MNLENFNSELVKRLDDFKTEKRNRGAALIEQLITDITENEWFCKQATGESDMEEWEKALIVAGLKSLMEEK